MTLVASTKSPVGALVHLPHGCLGGQTPYEWKYRCSRMAMSDRAGRWVIEVGRHVRSVNEIDGDLGWGLAWRTSP
jgi:hypothetical protein